MVINEIEVNGIDFDSYYFLNPIFVRIESSTKFVTKAIVSLTNRTAKSSTGGDLISANFELQSNPEGKVFFDLSDYVRSTAVEPNGYGSKIEIFNLPNSLNDFNISIKVFVKDEVDSTDFSIDKLLIYGGENSPKTNVFFSGESLSLSNTIDLLTFENVTTPYYKFEDNRNRLLSLSRYKVENKKAIEYYENESNINNLDHVKVGGCDNLMVRFLNSKGGYEHLLFERYTYSSKSEDSEDLIKLNDFSNNKVISINRSVDYSKEVTASGNFLSRHKYFIDELIRSPYVAAMFPKSSEFIEIIPLGNSVPETPKKSFDISFSFKIVTSINNYN